MPKAVLEDDRLYSVADLAEPDEIPLTPMGMAVLSPSGYLGTRAEIERELDGMAYAVRSFALKQPDQVMRECAAYSARLTELAVLLHRVESLDRQYTRIRTQQVERWLTELERQFKVASRLVEVARHDLELMR
jgi:hypothetical protein